MLVAVCDQSTGHFDVALLENHRAFVIADGGGAGLPLDLVVRGLAGFQA